MRYRLVLMLLLSPLAPAAAQVSLQIGLPSVRIGFDLPIFPQLVIVPGSPVYYDPGSPSNYFFYDGMYWVYAGDGWYASSWYNGPWSQVAPYAVPSFVLRVPVHYYRHPPASFRGWHQDAPPRWGERWGSDWERQRVGWDRWDHRNVPAPAPIPTYQRQYSGNRYPPSERQHELHSQYYRHEPHDDAVKRAYREQYQHGGPPPSHGEPHGSPGHPQQPGSSQQPAHTQQPANMQGHPSQPTHMQQPARAPEQGQGHQGQGKEQDQPQGNGPHQEHDR
jgi:hypothetical protein